MGQAMATFRALWVGLSPRSNAAAVFTSIRHAYQTRELLVEMTRREMAAGHAGHGLGMLWVFIHPLIIVLVYLLIIGFVIGGRLDTGGSFPGDYPSYMLIGLVPWLMLQAAIVRATNALVGNAGLVKQVVFPIEVLPVAAAAAASIPYVPALVLVLAYKGMLAGGFGWTTLLLPVAFLLHVMTVAGLAFVLSGLTAFLRDLREMVSVFCVIAMYLTPAIYVPDWVPAPLRPLIYLNPFSYLTWVYQDVLFFGSILHPFAWLVAALLAFASLGLGYRLFERLKPYYGNVL